MTVICVVMWASLLAGATGLRVTSGPPAGAAARPAKPARAAARLEAPPPLASNGTALALLAASGMGGALAATAGSVCVGGACVVGGAAAAPAAVAAFGSLQVWLAATLVALGVASGGPLLAGPAPLSPAMAELVLHSTPLDALRSSGRPSVVEFFRPNCPRCNRLAPTLVELEARAQNGNVNWVMINTDEPSAQSLVRQLGVSELPRFSFFDGENRLLGSVDGDVDPNSISSMLDGFEARDALVLVRPTLL